MKTTIAVLLLLVGILSSLLYLREKEVEVYEAHFEMQQRAILKNDSIIRVLNKNEILK